VPGCVAFGERLEFAYGKHRSTTCTNGNTGARRICATCCHCAAVIITPCMRAVGRSNSAPTPDSSTSTTPTTPCGPPPHPTGPHPHQPQNDGDPVTSHEPEGLEQTQPMATTRKTRHERRPLCRAALDRNRHRPGRNASRLRNWTSLQVSAPTASRSGRCRKRPHHRLAIGQSSGSARTTRWRRTRRTIVVRPPTAEGRTG